MIMKGRPHGSFVRRFFLSDGLSPDSIEASYVDGVLKLAIPVAEESKARKIEVVAGQIGRG
jgi:HSP20 family protein